MELRGINDSLQNVASSINYINLQWNRKYYEVGDFSIQLLQSDYDADVKYVWSPDRPEVGVVEKLETHSDITGDYIQLTGRFIESLFSRSVIVPRFSANGKPSTLSRNIVSTYVTDFPGGLLSLSAFAEDDAEVNVDVDYFGSEVDDATYALLKQAEKSQRVSFDDESLCFVHSVWSGIDRTQDQQANSYALFSDASDTDEIKITEDESGYKNYAVIALPDDVIIEYDGRTDKNEAIRRKFIDCSKQSRSSDQTQAQFEASCIQKAKEELAKWPRIRNVETQTSQNHKEYLVDYDLGDKCDIVNHKVKKSYQSRIIEVREVIKEGQHFVDVVFGDKIPTTYERVMNR